MNASLFKSYIKYRYKAILTWVIVVIAMIYFDNDGYSYLFYLLFPIISFTKGLFQFNDRLEYLKKLKTRGLTEQDIINIEFVKKWEDTRKAGVWRYCIRDGGIIAGAGLSLAIALLFAVIFPAKFKSTLSEPGTMLRFIGYCYIIGAFICVVTFKVLWHYREDKFIRLTDPLNIIFTSKKESYHTP